MLWDNDVLGKKSPIEQINKQKGAQELNVVWPLLPKSTTSQINPLIFVKKYNQQSNKLSQAQNPNAPNLTK